MTAKAKNFQSAVFLRRTALSGDEYRVNFRQMDCDVIDLVTSEEACEITPSMSKIYLKLLNARQVFFEREGVLRFVGEAGEEGCLTAWGQLVRELGVASATARKALVWLHDRGAIGYYAGRNGVGIRIFLNRAAASVASRAGRRGQKILAFSRTSSDAPRTSSDEVRLKDSYADSESSDKDLKPRAPKSGAGTGQVGNAAPDPAPSHEKKFHMERGGREVGCASQVPGSVSVDEVVARLRDELEPCVRSAASRAAAETASREMERTREWFETKALPKAVRVAQHETYELLRKRGLAGDSRGSGVEGLEVGRAGTGSAGRVEPHKLSDGEVRETAEACVAFLETQGKGIEVTLSEISTEAGGWLLPEDAPRVREEALALIDGGGGR